jgi:hypothetical protein
LDHSRLRIPLKRMAPGARLELATNGLTGRCSAD